MLWVRKNGTEIETNDRQETFDYCLSLGWTKKRKRRTKAEMEASDKAMDELTRLGQEMGDYGNSGASDQSSASADSSSGE